MNTANHEHHSFFDANMSFNDIIVRYTVMMVIGIVGGLTHQVWLMVLVVPVFVFAVTGWCPIHAILGRNTAEKT
jgi:hypothetical protein